jgi:hypothetical protein
MAVNLPIENRIVDYIDRKMDDAQLALNSVEDVPVSGLATGPARTLVGGGQLITAVAVSALRYAHQGPGNQHEINYILQDGIERSSRAVVNVFLGVVETFQGAAALLNPVTLFYRVFEYVNRPNPR